MKTLQIASLLAISLLAACASAPVAPPPKAAAAVTAPSAPAVELAPAQVYAQAREKLAAKDLAGAKAGLDAYLAKEPGSAAGHFDAGWVAEQANDRGSARDHYSKALKAEPAHLGAAVNLARLLKQDGRLADAQHVLEVALETRAGDVRLMNALSAVLRGQKKLDESEAVVRKILLRNPKNAGAYKNLGLIEADRGRLRLAEVALATARKLDEKDPSIPASLGLLAARRDDASLARTRFQEAVAIDASYAPAWANLAALALQFRDYPGASEAYAKATALDPTRTELHLAYGWALEGQRKHKEAREQYEQVLAQRPDNQDAMFGRALALKSEGNLAEAQTAFQAYVAAPGATRIKDAQNQLASIDIRLKSQATVAKAALPAKREAKGGDDLTALPIGKDEDPAAANAPALEMPTDEPDVPATVEAPKKDDKDDKKAGPARIEKANGEKGEAKPSITNRAPQATR